MTDLVRSGILRGLLAVLLVSGAPAQEMGILGLPATGFHGLAAAGPQVPPAPLPGEATPPAELVLVISIDGLRPDALQAVPTPHIDRLAASGAISMRARSADIPKTLPGHTSMVTGVQPKVHGFEFNRWRPWEGTLKQPTMFRWVRAAGLETTVVVAKRKFKLLNVPGDVGAFRVPLPRPWSLKGTSDRVVDKVLDYLDEGRRGLYFIHLPEVDDRGHRVGWMSPEQLAEVAFVDAQIGRLVAWTEEEGRDLRIAWIVTSDHGGHGKDHGELAKGRDEYLPEDVTVPFLMSGHGVIPGAQLGPDVSLVDVAPTACALLGVAPPTGLDGRALEQGLSSPPPAPDPAVAALPQGPERGSGLANLLGRWNPF